MAEEVCHLCGWTAVTGGVRSAACLYLRSVGLYDISLSLYVVEIAFSPIYVPTFCTPVNLQLVVLMNRLLYPVA